MTIVKFEARTEQQATATAPKTGTTGKLYQALLRTAAPAHFAGGVSLYRLTRLVRYQKDRAMPLGKPVQPAPKRMEPKWFAAQSGLPLH